MGNRRSSFKIRAQHLVISLFMIFACGSARADRPVHIISGGPSSVALFTSLKPDLEKAAGAPVEITVNPVDIAMVALSKGLIDGMLPGGSVAETMALAEKIGMPKQNLDDYQSTLISEVVIKIAVHPENPVKHLTRQQITDILRGKITNWEPITGQKIPLTVVMAKNYQATTTALIKFYLDNDNASAVRQVLDKDGMLKAMQRDPGVVGFFTERDSQGSFKPRYMLTDVTRASFLLMKKKTRPEAQKVFDFFKSRVPVRNE
jgi:hypothetical protein